MKTRDHLIPLPNKREAVLRAPHPATMEDVKFIRRYLAHMESTLWADNLSVTNPAAGKRTPPTGRIVPMKELGA